MIIQITPEGFIHLSGDTPEVGRTYTLEDATEGTDKQNRFFHPLVMEWFKSGCHSYDVQNWQALKEFVKRDMGAGFESYVYADEKGMHKVKTLEDIPAHIPLTHKMGKLKSWGAYTKNERRKTIDMLISTMIQSGVNSKKFHEILDGMSDK